MFMNLRQTVTFDDVLLIPQYSDIETRSSIDIRTKLKDVLIKSPIISAPMDTVVGPAMASALIDNGVLPILHRYNTPNEQVKMVHHAKAKTRVDIPVIGAAIGTSDEDLDRAKMLVEAGVSVLCVDVAHGHHIAVERIIKSLRDKLGSNVHIMAGNVATAHGFTALSDWGADSVRVGVGGGSICSTRIQTGHGIPTLQSVFDIVNEQQSQTPAAIIADGGIRTSGDIVKALAAGADAVMVGSLLAGTDEAPGEQMLIDGVLYKAYRGMASKEAQLDWRGRVSSIEGVAHRVRAKGPVANVLEELKIGIRSGFSYSGAKNIVELQTKSKFIIQSSAGQTESSTHVRNLT
jgi:IMP dehydrogenase